MAAGDDPISDKLIELVRLNTRMSRLPPTTSEDAEWDQLQRYLDEQIVLFDSLQDHVMDLRCSVDDRRREAEIKQLEAKVSTKERRMEKQAEKIQVLQSKNETLEERVETLETELTEARRMASPAHNSW